MPPDNPVADVTGARSAGTLDGYSGHVTLNGRRKFFGRNANSMAPAEKSQRLCLMSDPSGRNYL
jgi:hypothetical protein